MDVTSEGTIQQSGLHFEVNHVYTSDRWIKMWSVIHRGDGAEYMRQRKTT